MAKVEYCVIGYGRFGGQVADQLNELGKRVMVIENDPAVCDKISRLHEIVIKCDATDINALKKELSNFKEKLIDKTNGNVKIEDMGTLYFEE